jgi:two-component system, chemotaxis family, response regulator Rcp1
MGSVRPARILLVEDNPADVRLVQEAFRDARVPCELLVARDGVEALELLGQAQGDPEREPADLILLDLNLPRRDGREVLVALKGDPARRHIPVVVLTSSAAENDVRQAYDLQANCYVVKPMDLDRFLALMRAIEEFWLMTVRLPGRSAP